MEDNPRTVRLPFRTIEGTTPGRLLHSLPLDHLGVTNLVKAVTDRENVRSKIKLYKIMDDHPVLGQIGARLISPQIKDPGHSAITYLRLDSRVDFEKRLVTAILSAEHSPGPVEFVGISSNGNLLFASSAEESGSKPKGDVSIRADMFAYAVGLMDLDERTQLRVMTHRGNEALLDPIVRRRPPAIRESLRYLVIVEKDAVAVLPALGGPDDKTAVSESGAVEFFREYFRVKLERSPVDFHVPTEPRLRMGDGLVVENPFEIAPLGPTSVNPPPPKFKKGDRVMWSPEFADEWRTWLTKDENPLDYEGTVTRVKWENEFQQHVVYTDGKSGGRGVFERFFQLDERKQFRFDIPGRDIVVENPSALGAVLDRKRAELVAKIWDIGDKLGLAMAAHPKISIDDIKNASGQIVGYRANNTSLIEKKALATAGFRWESLRLSRGAFSQDVCGAGDALLLDDEPAAVTIEALRDYWDWLDVGRLNPPAQLTTTEIPVPDIFVVRNNKTTRPEEASMASWNDRLTGAVKDPIDIGEVWRAALPSTVNKISKHGQLALIQRDHRARPKRYLFHYTPPAENERSKQCLFYDYNLRVACAGRLERPTSTSEFAGVDAEGRLIFDVGGITRVAPAYVMDYVLALFSGAHLKMDFVKAIDMLDSDFIQIYYDSDILKPLVPVGVGTYTFAALRVFVTTPIPDATNRLSDEELALFFRNWFNLGPPDTYDASIRLPMGQGLTVENPPPIQDVICVVREALIDDMGWRRISDSEVEYVREDQSGSVVAKVRLAKNPAWAETPDAELAYVRLEPEVDADEQFCKQQLFDLERKLLEKMGKRFPVQFSERHEWVNGRWRASLGFALDEDIAEPSGKLEVVSDYWDFLTGRKPVCRLEVGSHPPETTSNPAEADDAVDLGDNVKIANLEYNVDETLHATLVGVQIKKKKKMSPIAKHVSERFIEDSEVLTRMAVSQHEVEASMTIVPPKGSNAANQGIQKATENYSVAVVSEGNISKDAVPAKLVGVNALGHVLFEDGKGARLSLSPTVFSCFLGLFGCPVEGDILMTQRAVIARGGSMVAFARSTFYKGENVAWEKDAEDNFHKNVLSEGDFVRYLQHHYNFTAGMRRSAGGLRMEGNYIIVENPKSGVFRGVQLNVGDAKAFDAKDYAFAGYWTRSPTVASLFAARPKNTILHDSTVKLKLERFLMDDPDSRPTDGPAWVEFWLDDVTSRRRSEMDIDSFGLIFRAEGDVDDMEHPEYSLEMEVLSRGEMNITDVGVIDMDTYPPLWIATSDIPAGATVDDVRKLALRKGRHVKWVQDTVPTSLYKRLQGACLLCGREPCSCGAEPVPFEREPSALDGRKAIDRVTAEVRNPETPKAKSVLVVIPSKTSLLSRDIGRVLDGWATVHRNKCISSKKYDFGSPSSRDNTWRRRVSKAMRGADVVVVLEDSGFVGDPRRHRVARDVSKANAGFAKAVADSIGGVLHKSPASDLQKEAEEFGRPSVTIYINRKIKKTEAPELASAIRAAVESAPIPTADKSIDSTPGKWCGPCRIFFRDAKRRRCTECKGKVVRKGAPPVACRVI